MLVKRKKLDKRTKKPVWDVRIRNEHGKLQFFPVGDTRKTFVKECEEKLKAQVREWKMFPEHKIKSATFREFVIKEYLPKHASGKRSERDYISICKKLNREMWADKQLQAITRHDVEPYLTRRYTERSDATANREFTILKGIFTKAEDWGFIPRGTNPCKGVKLVKEEPRLRILSTEESIRLLDKCKPIHDTPFWRWRALEIRDQIEIVLETGPRKEELLQLKCDDINFETRMVRYHGKGGKKRSVPMNKRAREILERRVEARNGNRKSFLFGDGGVAPQDFKRAFKTVCNSAGIEDLRIHDLRRTFGSRCAMAGVPPKTLQKWMGHEDIKTTLKYYVHIPEDFEKEAIEKLSDFRKNDSQDDS
ncbi:MAG: site-specific integrase [Nitrospiraceae bacterium]|nr:site-specific integrase [Nitrospiraceae bacterium]